MSHLVQAVSEAREAEDQAQQIAQILAVVQAAQAATPTAQHAGCSCSAQKSGGRSASTVTAWVVGGVACACVLTGLLLAVALVAVAVTVGGCVSYLLVREIRKGK